MIAIGDSIFTREWKQLGESLPNPKSILLISAHWYIQGTKVTVSEHPRTIQDFYGFSKALFDVQYPAPGSSQLVECVLKLLEPITPVEPDIGQWGLDHESWSILTKPFENADIPVVQFSIDAKKTDVEHFEVGKRLAPLSDEGVMIIASGSLVLNLYDMQFDDKPYDYTIQFENFVKQNIDKQLSPEEHPLINWQMNAYAKKAHPSFDHYVPLLYLLGLADAAPEDPIFKIVEGVDLSSISMLSFQLG